MDFFDWISPSLYWLFDIKEPTRGRGRHGALQWTEEEDKIIRRFYPNFAMLSLALPERSHNARKQRAVKLGVTKRINRWRETEIKWLKDNYPSASWADIYRNIPNRPKGSILGKTSMLGLKRKRKMMELSGIKLLENIRDKAQELNFTLIDLDEEAGVTGYFTNFSPENYRLLDALNKAISAMGGELHIRWYGE